MSVQDDRPYLLERVGDAAVVQVYADGFNALAPREKTLIYHLSRAALAGRDIYYDQRYAPSLDMREVVEAVVTHPESVDADTLARVHHYAKLFWLNSGPHNGQTARKFLLRCEPEAFEAAVRAAANDGARLPTKPGETLDGLLARLAPCFFDPGFDASITSKTPGEGRDILTMSANNLYDGVSLADLEGFRERYPLNSRLVKRDGRLVEEVYRVGGRYGREIEEVVRHLEAAVPYATPAMAVALGALIRCYRTGEAADREAYDIAWVRDKDSPVDTINGFVEVYLDARGVKGAWGSMVFFVNHAKTDAIRALARHAQWFEDHMPWDPKYRKADVTGISASAIDVVVESGDSGPLTPIGVNLPNDERVRERHGSKSVSLVNVMEAYERSLPASYWAEFSWTREEAERAARWSGAASELATSLHEVIGHGSGQADPALGTSASAALREYYSTIEETRADLVALYFAPHPKLAELGIVEAEHQAEIACAEYEAFARNALVQLRRVREGTHLEEDHMRNRQLIVGWLMNHTHAVQARWRDGKTFYVVTDVHGFHDGAGRLLAEVQRIKSQGDVAAAKALVDSYGTHFDPALRDEIVARVQRVDLPSYTGFVMPSLEPVHGSDGRIASARMSYPLDFTRQMLDYAGKTLT
ncbi:MAG: dipeptidyl peptidase 3 [Vicinamibacterales bacterium]|nr:dipeptidyl peptidase 3 [Vicinamibacterales bacterium]